MKNDRTVLSSYLLTQNNSSPASQGFVCGLFFVLFKLNGVPSVTRFNLKEQKEQIEHTHDWAVDCVRLVICLCSLSFSFFRFNYKWRAWIEARRKKSTKRKKNQKKKWKWTKRALYLPLFTFHWLLFSSFFSSHSIKIQWNEVEAWF